MKLIQNLKQLPNHIYLFIGIFLFVFVFPAIDKASVLDIFGPISYSIIILSIVSIIEKKKQKKMKWLYILVVLSITFIWLQYLSAEKYFSYLSFLFNILVFISATLIMISQIVKSVSVDVKMVLEAISGYLLLGVMFALTNSLIFSVYPNSFNLPNGDFTDVIYFSFITLTTVGYGDISPQTEIPKLVSVFFGLSSQLYLTIIMALIIGKYLNKNK